MGILHKGTNLKTEVKENNKTKLDALGLEIEDLSFILTAIRNSMISGTSLEQAVKTVYKLQTLYTKFDKLSTIEKNAE